MNENEEKYKAFLIDSEMKSKFEQAYIGVNEVPGKIESLTVKTIIVDRNGKTIKEKEDKNAKLV